MSKRVAKKTTKQSKTASEHRTVGKGGASVKEEEPLKEGDLKRVSGGIIRRPAGNHNETFLHER